MGQGEDIKTRPDPNIEIQERGGIFFFCRPKVDREDAHVPEEVQRLYLVLRPESGERHIEDKQEGDKKDFSSGGHGRQEVNTEKQLLLRLIVMGRKTLPDPSKKSMPYWGFVEMVTTKIEDLKAALQGGEYDTETRGRRHKPDAKAAGAGVYRILRHKTHTHLVYKLEQTEEEKEAFNIVPEASFFLRIKNPGQQGSSVGINRRIRIPFFGVLRNLKILPRETFNILKTINKHSGVYRIVTLLASRRLASISFTRKSTFQTVGGGRSLIRSTTGNNLPPLICTRRSDGF
ncbi:hypothetical protein F511_24625 [Dorcoceras hygrometricum]|uniref:Uncharacterized protein n=1 Tax=Dorcoceras hygrometricum TaxID=472368 RepID=A0A2Z7C6T0_9LAMI|nr:hypothetical protein F511_24625 [Dorcoceras hygrometricum]